MQQVKKKHPARRLLLMALKLAIALAGLWWVIGQISWNNRAVIAAGKQIRSITWIKSTPLPVIKRKADLITLDFAHQKVQVKLPSGKIFSGYADQYPILFPRQLTIPVSYLAQVAGQPEIEIGLRGLIRRANGWLLFAAMMILGGPLFLTAWRWRMLMNVQDMHLSYRQCLRLTFVGQFYSTFLPGTTSGDVVKIIYTARATGKKTQSAVTVLLDRVIGLIGLVVVGGVAATIQLMMDLGQSTGTTTAGSPSGPDPVLLHVIILTAGILLVAAVGGTVYFSTRLRRILGIDALMKKLPLPEFIQHADRTMRVYRSHLGVVAVTFAISLLSQSILPVAAFLAGRAFGMHAAFGCFMAYIPMAALAASLPIVPPQGIGVTEAILLHFFVTRGVDTASQSFALAQAIRFLPIVWNLFGAYWVVRGKFHRPTDAEVQDVETENVPGEDPPGGIAAV